MVEKTKFLGVMIDQRLTFNAHILFIKGKVARGIGIMRKCRKFFNSSTLLTLYYSFVYPYLNYCNCIWGNTCASYLDPLVKLQKRAIRIIAGAEWLAHTEPLFKTFKVLSMSRLFIYNIQLFLYKFYRKKVPEIFERFYIVNSDIHDHYTRQSEYFHTIGAKTVLRMRSTRVIGVNIFNFFYPKIDLDCSLPTYKYKLKHHLINDDIENIM